ncbi:MAG: ABC transporter permease [bacterium]|nr:ABC transporter permease [bacterium]
MFIKLLKKPGFLISSFLLVLAFLVPLLPLDNPSVLGNAADKLLSPSFSHPMGTDIHGRDVLLRLMHGSRVSLMVGWVSVLVTILLGTSVGLAAGLGSHRVDRLLMLITDLFLAFPRLFLILLLVSLASPSLLLVMMVIGLTGWMAVARLVRAEVLTLRERDYVHAAQQLGLSPWKVATHHILPNLLPIIIVTAALRVGGAVLTEAFLSFLGLGIQEPGISWGGMIQQGRGHLLDGWWLTTFPGLAIALTVIGYNLLADDIRRHLDPHHQDGSSTK